jgi:sorting and assembly machinery component 37
MMQLYVLGPAFNLPSISAECNAAVALIQLLFPDSNWQVVPTHEESERLPFLISDEGKKVYGFDNMTHHLKTTTPLNEREIADSAAIAAFLAKGQILLDISLYVSFDNYCATRSAFTKVLPWHANYIIPPRLRAAARQRTKHLGISSIDVDNVHEDMSNRPPGFDGVGKEPGAEAFAAETQKRASLLLPRKETVTSLLRKPEHASMIKLHALADNFFGPLSECLGDKQYLTGDQPTAIDCFAFGYLALMLYPELPQDWLSKTMKKKYPLLAEYTQRLFTQLVDLPWAQPSRSSITDIIGTSLKALVSQIPLAPSDTRIVRVSAPKKSQWQNGLPLLFGITTCSVGLGIYWALRHNVIWPRGEELKVFGRKRLSDYGHLGAALGGATLLGATAQNPA